MALRTRKSVGIGGGVLHPPAASLTIASPHRRFAAPLLYTMRGRAAATGRDAGGTRCGPTFPAARAVAGAAAGISPQFTRPARNARTVLITPRNSAKPFKRPMQE